MNEVQDAGAIAVVIGWVQIVKRMVPDAWGKFMPVAAVALGVVYAMAMRKSEGVGSAFLAGLMIGLGASGTFSTVKNVAESVTKKAGG